MAELDRDARLIEYLRRDIDLEGTDRHTLRARVRAVFPSSLRPTIRSLATWALLPGEYLKARRLAETRRGALLLHLGSGEVPKRGWVNIDMPPSPADLYWDLRLSLPFASGSIRGMFLEHLLEHFDLRGGYRLIRDAHRLLEPDGVLRVGVPDAEAFIRSYADGTDWLEEILPGRPTALVALQEVFYRHRHRAAYDSETLQALLRSAGFREVRQMPGGESGLPACPDSEHRRPTTLYVEARRERPA